MPYRPRPQGMQGAAGMMGGMAMSDEHSKQRIQELEGELSQVYSAMGGATAQAAPDTATRSLDSAYRQPGAYSYEYKNPSAPGAGPGRYAGPMAQELEGIPGVVQSTPYGKQVDTPRLTLANTSEVANLRREVDSLKETAAAMGDGQPRKAKPKAKAAAIDTSTAPTNPGVDSALNAFGKKAPSDAEIAAARESLRGKYGAASANEFERRAMALKKEKNRSRVKIGEAQIERPPEVEFGPAQIERGGRS
jgi:hypothetical protein